MQTLAVHWALTLDSQKLHNLYLDKDTHNTDKQMTVRSDQLHQFRR